MAVSSEPEALRLEAAIEGGIDRNWAMNQGFKIVAPGDRIFFWISGQSARLVAAGRVTSPVYEKADGAFGRHAIDVTYESLVQPPLTKEEIKLSLNPSLRNFKPFYGFMGTNLLLKDAAVVAALDATIADRLTRIDSSQSPGEKTFEVTLDVDRAIKRANDEVRARMRDFISTMDPFDFEWLIRALLEKLGYTDLKVTKQSNDRGVDLRGTLAAGGIASLQTAVQVKRSPSVGPPGRPVAAWLINRARTRSAHCVGLFHRDCPRGGPRSE